MGRPVPQHFVLMKKLIVCLMVLATLFALTGCDLDSLLSEGDPMGQYAGQVEESKEQIEQGMQAFQKVQEETQGLLDKYAG